MPFLPPPIEPSLAAAVRHHNGLLAAEGCALRLEIRGGRLGLRGPLPDRLGGGQARVQRLSLGLTASPTGLTIALERLARLRQELASGRFQWHEWKRASSSAVEGGPAAGGSIAGGLAFRPLAEQLEAFEVAFRNDPKRRRRPAGSRSTWAAAYRPYLRRLAAYAAEQQPGRLDADLLVEVLESYELSSRSRQQCGVALAALARHLQLELPDDWRDRAAGYGLHLTRFRPLPTDSQILELVLQIPNPRWRLAYGLMATYGLRNHEVFFCDGSALAPGADRVLRVLPTSKTGEHQVWPFQPEWIDHFDLERLGRDPKALPIVNLDLRRTTLQQVGRRVAEQFRRYGLPITPYDLRHAWAVRTIHIGLPDTVAARMMGHSVAIHTRTYHHWITRRDQQQAVDAALARRAG
ncbi:MAG: site-specific integrase [Cyanobacteriota bacterium]